MTKTITYTTPGYNDEPLTAKDALDEWTATFDYDLSEEDAEQLYQFTLRHESPEFNLAAIQAGAEYLGLDLVAIGYPLPVAHTN